MKRADDQLLKIKEIAFIGKVTASLSHDIKNILAIINESSGLAGDLLTKGDQKENPHLSRLTQINISMQEQVKRGVEIVKRLNRFAHSMDEEASDSDLNDIILLTADIAKRLARLKGVGLETIPTDNPIIDIRNDPFKIEQILFGCIEYLLDLPAKKSLITITVKQNKDDTSIIISDDSSKVSPSCGDNGIEKTSDLQMTFLNILMDEIGGSVNFIKSQSGNTITLSLPLKPP
ncbi:MAG: HAMP domain-containing histidine kinase [Desulfobacterales bacterium]|nr:HAMP domain-containing histidine kinase [Desulfobacterales bacterium]